jgi:hypothetical protein
MSHIRCMAPPKEHYTQRWAPDSQKDRSRIVGDGLMSHIRLHVPPKGTHLHQRKVGQDGEDSPDWLGMVSHVSHIRCMYHLRDTFTQWAPDS